jgi:heterodisulfide reductase subunit A-like polyferredoxin
VAVADSLTVAEDATTNNTVNVLTNDTDVDTANAAPNTDVLTLVSCTAPTNGTRAVNTSTGVVTYTPNAHYIGADTFNCTIRDAANVTSTAAVNITVTSVNDAPVAVADTLATTRNNAATVNVLTNDTDVDLANAAPNADSLSLVSCTNPSNGAVATNVNGDVTYTPDNGFTGNDSFNCTIKDLADAQSTAAVSVTVTAP